MKPSSVFQMLFDDDDVKWQSLIYELVRTGKVDPWDVDITKFANEYLGMLEKLKQMNFRVSGKVVLAAAILLKLKMHRIGLEDFIMLTEDPEEELPELDEEQFIDEEEAKLMRLAKHIKHNKKKQFLEPRLVGPRSRKVTVFELMDALKKAIEVDERREVRRKKFMKQIPKEEVFKRKKLDIFAKMKKVYEKLMIFVKKAKKDTVEFNHLVPSKEKKDIIWTFVPLLHLANEGKVSLTQDKPFSKLYVELVDTSGRLKKNERTKK